MSGVPCTETISLIHGEQFLHGFGFEDLHLKILTDFRNSSFQKCIVFL